VGSARSEKHGLIVVARYSPMGSTGGPASFMDNVPPPSKLHSKMFSINCWENKWEETNTGRHMVLFTSISVNMHFLVCCRLLK